MLRKITIIYLIIISLSCSNIKERQNFSFLGLNTTCSITIYNSSPIDIEEVKAQIMEIENLMSSHVFDSDVSNINRLAGITFYKPSESTLTVIREGIKYGVISNGEFDITIGPLISLWDINNKTTVPNSRDIENLLPLVNYNNIIIEDKKVMLQNKDMSIDLGGIAKGYASNRLKDFLVSRGVKSAIINLGGNIDLIGLKNSNSLWSIGIQHPRKIRGNYIGLLRVEESSFVSSGDYERFFIEDGIRYHHILDSFTGYPKNGDIISSSILDSSAIKGDALSTITFGRSISDVKKLRESIEFEGVFITRNKEIYITDALKNIFTLKDETYSIIP
ncbi:FAD:protein FMN transferase [Thiospirochaeta perfilievii]|uniref:FAD:protein FMN transferase n=1 Tax=Thiospirochaeta perfilievii TaxID=252967 RepID=A0A5C1Q8T4_9SPIO|nr:FAD:protein FMN transferase [Thiospirochaeta perfilievii]QEN03778.1 FAD:protein FMN transferase [Thiospirochaeta perfilievii]